MSDRHAIELTVNGRRQVALVEPRATLADLLRTQLELTGTHLGCEHGVCGACTVLVDGLSVRSCLMLAVQAQGRDVTTVEGLTPDGGGPDELHPLQEALWRSYGLQCGFCTPGMLMTATALLREHPTPSRELVRERLAGNLCRCTGYGPIVDAVVTAAGDDAGHAEAAG